MHTVDAVREFGFSTYSLTVSQDEIPCSSDVAKAISEALSQLTVREKSVIIRRFGLDDGNCATLKQCSSLSLVNAERVRQIEGKALRKLKRFFSKTVYKTIAIDALRSDFFQLKSFDICVKPILNTDMIKPSRASDATMSADSISAKKAEREKNRKLSYERNKVYRDVHYRKWQLQRLLES